MGKAAGPGPSKALGAGLTTKAISDQWDVDPQRCHTARTIQEPAVGWPVLRLVLSLGWAGRKGHVGFSLWALESGSPEFLSQLYYLLIANCAQELP